MPLSSRGLGRLVLSQETPVQIRLAAQKLASLNLD